MSRLESLSKYFTEKERKKLNNLVKNSNDGVPTMTEDEIKLTCIENNGYETPELNDKLYLHFRGFRKIENLEKYTGCKALWLDSNGLDKIQGLCNLSELRCLYLGKNLISQIEGLDNLMNLHTIDLSYNRISHISGLACCRSLKTLIIARNNLSTAESIRHLSDCLLLECLDITNNTLEGEDVMSVVANIPRLVTLSINGNEVTKQPSFRKKTIAAMPRLGYLDRPIEEIEKIGAIAYVSGGAEAESRVRDEYREEQKKKKLNESLVFRAWQQEQKEKKKKEIAEGKTFYKEFTREEKEEMVLSAARAAEEERLMLKRGFDKLTEKYWDNPAREIEAADFMDENKDDEKAESSIDDESNHDESEDSNASGDREMTASNNESKDDIADDLSDLDKALIRAREIEAEEERERSQRVADSITIYRRQQAEKKAADEYAKESSITASQPSAYSTWDAALNAPHEFKPFRVTLEWSLLMDLKLAELVRECFFDFDKIFLKMISAASDGILGDIPKAAVALISSEACRLRWSDLDASQWSDQPENSTIMDVVYRVCIDPEEVSDGNGGQLSFDKLAAKTSNSFPKYLIPPTTFPSVRSEEDDDNESDEEEDILDLRNIALEMKRRC